MLDDDQILMMWWIQEDIEVYAHDVWWACWVIYGWNCTYCWKTDNNNNN